MSPLRRSLRTVTLSGCLAMVYIIGTTTPAFTEFLRQIGANEVHFGLLSGIPLIMLVFQYVGAVIANRVTRRKRLFMTALIAARALFLPLALVPWLRSAISAPTLVVGIIVLLAVSAALANLGGPLWFSWMADLIPDPVLNRYWGWRQRWMYAVWTLAYLGVAVFFYLSPLPIMMAFPALLVISVTAGIVDIALFTRVKEPRNIVVRNRSMIEAALEPFRDRSYRTFVQFSCVWMGFVMFGAAFMQLYVLKVLELPVWKTTLAWCMSGVGNALTARAWGRLADRYGQRPVLVLCTALKSLIVLVFVLITPQTAFVVLTIAFFFDSMLNAGLLVGQNGYMMKIAPRANRSMFVAAIMGLAGICGGLGAIVGGGFLKACSGFQLEFAGRVWINYHLLFLVSIPLRLLCFGLARRIREPASAGSLRVLDDIMGVWPLRFRRFPVGFYRSKETPSAQAPP